MMTKDKALITLWNILDYIDSASDWCKGDNEQYRKAVKRLHEVRWQLPHDEFGINTKELKNE